MRPAPIPDEAILPGSKRIVIGPPGNRLDSTVAPIEACHLVLENGIHTYSVRLVLEPGDIKQLDDGAAVWLTFMEHVVPFMVQIGD